jgi:hypothetical protein
MATCLTKPSVAARSHTAALSCLGLLGLAPRLLSLCSTSHHRRSSSTRPRAVVAAQPLLNPMSPSLVLCSAPRCRRHSSLLGPMPLQPLSLCSTPCHRRSSSAQPCTTAATRALLNPMSSQLVLCPALHRCRSSSARPRAATDAWPLLNPMSPWLVLCSTPRHCRSSSARPHATCPLLGPTLPLVVLSSDPASHPSATPQPVSSWLVLCSAPRRRTATCLTRPSVAARCRAAASNLARRRRIHQLINYILKFHYEPLITRVLRICLNTTRIKERRWVSIYSFDNVT